MTPRAPAATVEPRPETARPVAPDLAARSSGGLRPVQVWAVVGALLLALQAYVLIKWVTGPNFERLGAGPDSPPDWMRTVLDSGQIGFSLGALACFYFFLVRPWRRERRVTIDGILCVGFLIAGFFDPLSNFSQHWFTYNSYLLNWGSPMTEIPGVTALNTADANQALSIPLVPAGYVVVFVLCSILGSNIMRAAKRRWPQLGPISLIAICFVCMAAIDIVVEGLFFMRLGFWSYAGGHAPLFFGDTYYKYPLQVLIGSGIFFSVGPCIRYFVNDRGETIGERGLSELRLSRGRKTALRFLAVIATLQIALLTLYHVPQSIIANSSPAWPRDVQERSYFTHGLCGPEVDRACPGPGVPLTRPGAPYLDYQGELVQPAKAGAPVANSVTAPKPSAALPEIRAAERPIVPVKWWAALGAVILIAQAAIVVAWIFSEWFHHVDSGPTPVPGWMKVVLIGWQVVLPIAGLAVIYWFVVRPWRRERRLGVDGLLVVAFSTLWFQDPISAYGGEWFTYNAWMVNMGSWVHSVPGWLAPGTPDHQIAYPLLVVPGAYICVFLLVSFLGSSLMRAIKARRPQTGRLTLVACCFVAMALFDVFFEGIVFMPLGAWEYPGGHWAIFPETYHKYPLNEALTTGMIFTAFASIKYFVDDRGLTAERGAEKLSGSPRRVWAIRALAVTGLVQLAMFLGYTAPNFMIGLHSTDWNADIQERSYLTYTCGPRTDEPCPPSAIEP